jgi:hypothetical protein
MAEAILRKFLQQFKEQAIVAIDDFAYQHKGGDNVSNIVDCMLGNNTTGQNSVSSANVSTWGGTLGSMNASGALVASLNTIAGVVPTPPTPVVTTPNPTPTTTTTTPTVTTPSTTASNPSNPVNTSNVTPMSPNNNILSTQSTGSVNSITSVNTSSSESNVDPSRAVESNKALEQLLSAFATVSKHSINSIAEAMYDWRVHLDCKPSAHVRDKIEEHVKQTYKKSMHVKQESELVQLYTERKEIAADYMFCCVLLLMLKSFHEPELAQNISEQLEHMCFHAFKRSFLQMSNGILIESKKKVFELFAEIIGLLSVKRFQPITDNVMDLVTHPSTSRGEAVQYIRALKYVRLQLSKVDQVTRSTNLMKKLFDFYSKSKKSDVKHAVCEAGANMLSPLAAFEYKSGIDYREWFEILKNILQAAIKFSRKTKHQLVAFPFISTILCLSPQKTFMDFFWQHMESLFRLLQRDKASKLVALDCILHVLGFFMKILNENKAEASKAGIEKLQRTVTTLFYSGRKIPPSFSNDQVYDAIVDIVVMIANNKLDFAINNAVMDLLRSENSLSE